MKISDKTPKEISDLYDMIYDEINDMCDIIEKKTGYFTTGNFSIFEDHPKKCMNIQMDIALLERPHEAYENKVQYYQKVNPDNVIDKPILANKHNSWYMVYNGVHRLEANKRLGNKTVNVNIIVPKPKK